MTTQQIKREFESYKKHGQICRLCMSEEALEDVFKDDHLTEWIQELLAIKISGDDRMSQVICTICRIRLTEFHQFRMGCHEVQEVLQALIPDGTDEAQSANTPVQTDPKATNQLQRIGIVDDSLIRCEVCLLVFNDEKQLTNHKTIHDHENQKDIQVKSELDEYVELELQGNDHMSFEKAEISSHIQNEEMENDLLGIEDCLVVEEVKIETRADDEVEASAESQHNKIKNEEVHRCDICQNEYSNKIQLKNHKKYHIRTLKKQATKVNGAIPEEKDSEKLLAVSDSSTNQKKEDCEDEIHQCDGCPKTFLTRRKLYMHKRNLHFPKRHRCDTCDVQFATRTALMRHMRSEKHMNKEQEIQKRVNEKTSDQNEKVCEVSDKHDNNKTIKHSKLSSAKYQPYRSNIKDCGKLLKCNECDKTFTNSRSLRVHTQHHTRKKIICHVCERPYQNRTLLKRHLATHASPAEHQQAENAPKPFKCDICKTAYMKKCTLRQHNREVHGPKKFQCEICGYKFSRNGFLMKHLQKHTLSGHTKEDFQALKKLSQQNDETTNQNDNDEMSDKSSVPSDNETNENDKAHKDPRQQRNMHMNIHEPASTATKQFECPECRQIYTSWQNLYVHVQNGHVRKQPLPKDRTVACPKCDKMFQLIRQRDKHLRTIHIEHKCQICNKKFSKRVQLRHHMHYQHVRKSASSDSKDTAHGSGLVDSVQNSNEEITKPLEPTAGLIP